MQTEDAEIIEAMIRLGGGFVSALGRAWQRADPQNAARLRVAFPEYWQKYRDLAVPRVNGIRKEQR
jgi:hypothetical protein